MSPSPARVLCAAALLAGVLAGCGSAPTPPAPAAPTVANAPSATVVSGAGDITPVVQRYRALLGEPDVGRREINWDGVPDQKAAPAFLPSDFFAARGAVFTTPGNGVQVSAKEGSGTPPRFGHVNPTYADQFTTFSAERLFSPIGSNVVDLTFVVPGTTTPALVRGFGAVYTDVDTDHTAFEYFDAAGASLGTFATPTADAGLSFLGVAFDDPIVARVQIKYGTAPLGPDDSTAQDVAVMDNFIYGEPTPLVR